MPLWVPIIAALLGALVGGLFQAGMRIFDRRREQATTLVAIVSEVSAISEMIAHENYVGKLAEALNAGDAGACAASICHSNVRIDHFGVFTSLAPKLGLLNESQARNIVRFHSLCRYAADALHPSGRLATLAASTERLDEARDIKDVFQKIMELGERISAYIERERYLTPGEKRLVTEVMSGHVDLRAVKVKYKKYVLFQADDSFTVARRRIFVKHTAGVWSDDYSKEDVRKQGLFLHQMVHIWQYERLGRIRFLIRYAREFVRCRLKAAAMFRYEERQAFAEAYLEAQAKMVEHYFVARATGRTRSDLQVSLAGTGFYGL